MTLPIDEMLLDLRSVLDDFQDDPTDETLHKVFSELRRISNTVEDEFYGVEQMTYEVQKRFAPQWFPWLKSDNEWKRCCKCVDMNAVNRFLGDEQKLPSYSAYEYRILECEE